MACRAGQELLALNVELRIQLIVLGVMLELGERRERAVRAGEHNLPGGGLLGERHHDAAEFLVAGELAPVEPCNGLLDRLALFIEHGDQVAAGAGLLQEMPLADADQRAAAAPAANELHNPRAAPGL